MKKGIKIVIALILTTLFISCSLKRSDILKDKNVNMCCKVYLECIYHQQKKDKATCNQFSNCCQKLIIREYCKAEKDQDRCWDKIR